MTLVQQFPDISEAMRLKRQMRNKDYSSLKLELPLGYVEDEEVVKFYEGEFKRWHIKLLLIVAATLALLFTVSLKIFWIYNSIT